VRRLLLVDDDALLAALLHELLSAESWDVTIARSLAQARSRLAESAYDVLVLDNQLPDGSGEQLAGELHGRLPGVHVVLHSGSEPGAVPPGVSAVVPKRAGVDALLDHVAASAQHA
jgi:DNA-binding response OmpR family regulator